MEANDTQTNKNQAQTEGRTENRPTECLPDSPRTGTTHTEDRGNWAESLGIHGEPGEGRNTIATHGSLNGGILRQLIETERERLGEAKECIDWYEKQVEKCQKRLAELAALERLEREQSNGH